MLACLFVLGLASPAIGSDPEGGTVHHLETAQAEVMPDVLERASKGPVEDNAVTAVLADPRQLLVAHNAAAVEGDAVFDAELAEAVAGIGGPAP